jgi:hypothetical protein
MSDEVDGALTALALGAFLVVVARFEMTLWGDEDVGSIERNTYAWSRSWARRGLARWLHRYARPAGYVLIGSSTVLLLLLAII